MRRLLKAWATRFLTLSPRRDAGIVVREGFVLGGFVAKSSYQRVTTFCTRALFFGETEFRETCFLEAVSSARYGYLPIRCFSRHVVQFFMTVRFGERSLESDRGTPGKFVGGFAKRLLSPRRLLRVRKMGVSCPLGLPFFFEGGGVIALPTVAAIRERFGDSRTLLGCCDLLCLVGRIWGEFFEKEI